MDDKPTIIESVLDRATDYAKTSYELIKLKTMDKTADVISSLIPYAVSFVILIQVLLLVNIGLALWLGEILDSFWNGFFALAGFYLIIGTILHLLFHNYIKNFIRNLITKMMLK
ncbi:MAG: hypothetical protein A2W91_08420 [Bacteroidetes bacterium GWF2_38_335]|nr:MAG: hypothetical protein A2W91_08420 [Bacteroidetes bacterium GWF2_38_335]OFY78934.1 MAG: hypothetical protein A2281_02300 [Bacteroidetes bacterium RIFOXYA12_FULL_38_20]HBS85998.1 hypothetical protein [Bacteroidales bacterium]